MVERTLMLKKMKKYFCKIQNHINKEINIILIFFRGKISKKAFQGEDIQINKCQNFGIKRFAINENKVQEFQLFYEKNPFAKQIISKNFIVIIFMILNFGQKVKNLIRNQKNRSQIQYQEICIEKKDVLIKENLSEIQTKKKIILVQFVDKRISSSFQIIRE